MKRARWLLASVPLLALGCIVTSSSEPWAPLRMTLDEQVVHSQRDVFVYVDGDYRGNFVDGKFVVYLTLEQHDLKVVAAGFEDWNQSITFGREEYPDGRTVVVQPARGP